MLAVRVKDLAGECAENREGILALIQKWSCHVVMHEVRIRKEASIRQMGNHLRHALDAALDSGLRLEADLDRMQAVTMML